MSHRNLRQPLISAMPLVATMGDLHQRTDELFYAQAGLAAFGKKDQLSTLRRAQEAYLAQYYETAGHVIALADGLGLAPAYVQSQRGRRHAAIYQAACERPIWGKNSWKVGPWSVGQDLIKLHDRSDNKLTNSLSKLLPESEWSSIPLDGYEQYKSAMVMKELVAEDLVAEDQVFCSKVVPVLGLIALREPYDLLQAIL